ncbi:MAG TPA: hypothetical protein VF263_16735 [Longimicrobiaceae bacterium]
MDAPASTAPKPFVFVLMPFDPAFDDVYTLGIKEAAASAGAHCERVDEQVFDGAIVDRILNQIARADVIVAEMTGRNANVFYETGYAHALGKRVILVTRQVEDIPHDLKHFPHVVYGGRISELRDEVERRVRWSIENPAKPLSTVEPMLEFFHRGVPLRDATLTLPGARLSGGVGFELTVHNTSRRTFRDEMARIALVLPRELPGVHAFDAKTVPLPDGTRLCFLRFTEDVLPEAWDVLATGLVGPAPEPLPAELPLRLRVYSEVSTQEIPFLLRVE